MLFKKGEVRFSIFLLVVGCLYFYISLFQNALVDDAFITLCYSRSLLESGTWGLFPGCTANSATSPLNVFLLAATALLAGTLTDAVKWLTLAYFVLLFLILERISLSLFEKRLFGYVTFVALIANPLLISTMGLESFLFTVLFLALILMYLREKWSIFAVIAGLLTLSRPEGALAFLLFLVLVPNITVLFQVMGLYILCIAPWYIFSWIHLGSILPDTFFIKTFGGSWTGWTFSDGIILYLKTYPVETVLSLLFLPLLPMLFIRTAKKWALCAVVFTFGSLHFVFYSLLGVAPFHWYYTPEQISIIFLGALALISNYYACHHHRKAILLRSLVFCYALLPVLGMLYLLERDGFYLEEAPIHSNWATHAQYRKVASSLRDLIANEPTRVRVEVGTLAFYSKCHLINEYTDRSWIENAFPIRPTDTGLISSLLKLNFLFFGDPGLFQCSYLLTGHWTRDVNCGTNCIGKWETYTKWAGHRAITLTEQDR